MDINPYESPLSEDSVPPTAPVLVSKLTSGMRPRILAHLLDTILAFATCYFGGLAAAQFNEVFGGIVFVSLYLLYFFLFEGALAATPGKFVMGLRVCDFQGRRCTWFQAAIRTMFRPLELNPLVCGELPAWVTVLCTERRQRLGDLCAQTVVIYATQMEDD